MRQSDMSRSVDKLAKDVFRTGQRVGRRGRAVLPESGAIGQNTMKEKGQNKRAKEKLVNETIYEESQECWEKNNQFEGQTNDKEVSRMVSNWNKGGYVIAKAVFL